MALCAFSRASTAFVVEEGNEALPVVLVDNVYDFLAQAVLPGKFDPVFYVGDENQAAH